MCGNVGMRLMAAVVLAAAGVGCCTKPGMEGHDHMAMMHENMWASVDRAVAVIKPTGSNSVAGTIWFDKAGDDVRVHGDFTGLAPNSTHAVHIHEFGDQSSADGAAAGSHYDPEGTKHHGKPGDTEPHHPGDLGNVTADATGKASLDVTLKGISIAGMKDPILGRGVVIHANADDFSQPVGNAGGRLGVGVIGIAKNPS